MQSLRIGEEELYLPYPEHIKEFNPMWKIIKRMTPLEDFLAKAYVALKEDLAIYYRYERRIDSSIRKNIYDRLWSVSVMNFSLELIAKLRRVVSMAADHTIFLVSKKN